MSVNNYILSTAHFGVAEDSVDTIYDTFKELLYRSEPKRTIHIHQPSSIVLRKLSPQMRIVPKPSTNRAAFRVKTEPSHKSSYFKHYKMNWLFSVYYPYYHSNTFPGFIIMLGSNVLFNYFIVSNTVTPFYKSIYLVLCYPMPCSADMEPPNCLTNLNIFYSILCSSSCNYAMSFSTTLKWMFPSPICP